MEAVDGSAYTPVCAVCLNSERRLKPTEDLLPLYESLVFDDEVASLELEPAFCWECRALLRRLAGFKERARQARITLQYLQSVPIPADHKLQCNSTLHQSRTQTFDSLTPNETKNYEVEIKFEEDDPFDGEVIDALLDIAKEEFEPMDDVPLARRSNKKKKKEVKKRKVKLHKTKSKLSKLADSERYNAVRVSEQQLHRWRLEDASNERYLRLPHKCTTCLVAFNFSDQLAVHNAKKHEEVLGPHACDICACRYANDKELRDHREVHLVRYDCTNCEYRTRDKKDIDKHHAVNHSRVSYVCNQCDAVFKTASHLRYHKDDKHGGRWECKHCGKTFRLRNNMYSHMLIHKKLPEAPCQICGKVMRNKYSLKLHMKTHEPTVRSWYCQQCDAHFKLESGYRNHLNTSMKHLTPDKLKYGCEACGRRFVTEKRRVRHYNSVHLKKSEFECDKCSKTYSTKLALKNHIAQKHEENYAGPPRDKICDICGKGFAVIGILKSHMRTHTGERPYQCELCPSTFSHHAALYTHKRLVHLKMKRKKTSKKTEDTPSDKDSTGQSSNTNTAPGTVTVVVEHKVEWETERVSY